MARKLTTRFMSYTIGQFEKQNKCSILDALEIGNFEVNKIVQLIMLGNHGMTEEDAYTKLDGYLYEDDDNSLITAYLDLIEEMDKDIKVLKTCGISVADLKNDLLNKITEKTKSFSDADDLAERAESVGLKVVD